MNIIKFSESWDKLKTIDGFTTIRSSNPDKSRYYKSSIGKEFDAIHEWAEATMKVLDLVYPADIFTGESGTSLPAISLTP